MQNIKISGWGIEWEDLQTFVHVLESEGAVSVYLIFEALGTRLPHKTYLVVVTAVILSALTSCQSRLGAGFGVDGTSGTSWPKMSAPGRENSDRSCELSAKSETRTRVGVNKCASSITRKKKLWDNGFIKC